MVVKTFGALSAATHSYFKEDPGLNVDLVEGATRMNQELGSGWTVDITRGPDWLFVRLEGNSQFDSTDVDLAARVWNLVDREFANRIVLEMENVPLLSTSLVGELVQLHARITSQGGLMRISGLSEDNFAVLQACRLAERFPHYLDRHEAVLGYRPAKPR